MHSVCRRPKGVSTGVIADRSCDPMGRAGWPEGISEAISEAMLPITPAQLCSGASCRQFSHYRTQTCSVRIANIAKSCEAVSHVCVILCDQADSQRAQAICEKLFFRLMDLRSLQQILCHCPTSATSNPLVCIHRLQLTVPRPRRSKLLMYCACRMLLQILGSQQCKVCGSCLQHLLIQGELRGVHPMHCSSRLVPDPQKDKGRRNPSLPIEGEILPAECGLIVFVKFSSISQQTACTRITSIAW